LNGQTPVRVQPLLRVAIQLQGETEVTRIYQ